MCCRKELGCLLCVQARDWEPFLDPNSGLSFPITYGRLAYIPEVLCAPISGAIRMVLIESNFKAAAPRIVLISETFTFTLLSSPLSPSLCLSWSLLTAFKLCFKISIYQMWGRLQAHEWFASFPRVLTPHWEY